MSDEPECPDCGPGVSDIHRRLDDMGYPVTCYCACHEPETDDERE